MKEIDEKLCELIERESNADCRGCVTKPCPLIDEIKLIINFEKEVSYNQDR